MGIDSSAITAYRRYQRIEQLLQQGLSPIQVSDRLGITPFTVHRATDNGFQVATPLHTQYLLTSIELETIKLAAMGYSNYAIAYLLSSAYKTVDWRLEKVYRKLDISHNRHIYKRITAANMLSEFLIDR